MSVSDRTVAALAEAGQEQAAEIEQLAALVTSLRGRLDALDQHQANAAVAQTALAERVERLAAEVKRFDALEKSFTAARGELANTLAERLSDVQAEIAAGRAAAEREDAAAGRATAALGARVEALETAAAQDDTGRHVKAVQAEIAALTLSLQAVHDRAEALERRPPRPEPTTLARIEDLAAALRASQSAVDGWQLKIEEQARIVRSNQEVAAAMEARAAAMADAHHATAEAQRVAEAHLRSLLQELRTEIAERWDAFLVERRHDWAALAAENEGRDRVTAEAAARLAAEADAVRVDFARLDETRDDALRELHLLRQSVVRSLDGLREAYVAAGALVESGVPYDERSAVLEERQKALRRALRARRAAPEP